jgi:hypothetical protein
MADIRIPLVEIVTPTSDDTVTGTQAGAVKRFAVSDFATSAALAASSGASLVGFVQSGAGAVARTAAQRMNIMNNEGAA